MKLLTATHHIVQLYNYQLESMSQPHVEFSTI